MGWGGSSLVNLVEKHISFLKSQNFEHANVNCGLPGETGQGW